MEFSHVVLCMGLLVAGASSLKLTDGIMWFPDSQGALHAIDVVTPNKEDFTLPFFKGEKQVNISCYTQQNRDTAERITLGDNTAYPHFNSSNPTRVVIHGWTADATRFIMVKDAYMETGSDYNVLLVDWKKPAATAYPIAKAYSVLVGKYLAKVIKYLQENKGLNYGTLNIIGHSLGAHVAGVTGNRIGARTVARIVGLDPAAPLYTFTPKKNRLDIKDAKIVEAIHTNAGICGWKTPLGTVDFYPNGGTFQPGCGIDLGGFCSHSRAPYLYAESITSKDFVSTHCTCYHRYKQRRCAWWRHDAMGEKTSRKSHGRYYLMTNGKEPYAQGRTDK